ncbi:MAG: hypothetical protein P1V97_15815 [Planctomycetota bacterium]|nr:hypothetical protein [Planctomycetota bacterium]
MSTRMILVTILLASLSVGCNTREWDDTGYNGKAKLKIVNATSAETAVVVNRRFEGSIAPNSSRVFGVEPGKHALSVGFADTGESVFIGNVRLRSYNRVTYFISRQEPPILPDPQ